MAELQEKEENISRIAEFAEIVLKLLSLWKIRQESQKILLLNLTLLFFVSYLGFWWWQCSGFFNIILFTHLFCVVVGVTVYHGVYMKVKGNLGTVGLSFYHVYL